MADHPRKLPDIDVLGPPLEDHVDTQQLLIFIRVNFADSNL